jgi:iron complex transport system permease protein
MDTGFVHILKSPMIGSPHNLRFGKWILSVIVLLVLLIIVFVASVSIGDIPFYKILSSLESRSGLEYAVLTNLRIPRAVLALSVGGALSLSGTILQGVYRNPLVEPYTMGISGGAALGVAICIVLGLHTAMSPFMLPLSGFIGAFTNIFLVYFLSMKKQRAVNINRMLLIGVMISFISTSAMQFFMSLSTVEDLHSIVFWTMGSLNEPNRLFIKLSVFTSIAGLIISYIYVIPLNALRLGEVKAKHLGINTVYTIKILFIVASLVTGISVSVVGVIGFVGLIIPHFVRSLIGSDYRGLLLASFLGGGIFLILCDILARTLIAPNELPIGVITGILGGIVFIVALSKKVKDI